MPWYEVIWNYEPGGNVEHIAEHGITPDEVEEVLFDPLEVATSRTSGRPVAAGYVDDGRLIFVVYEQIDDVTVYPLQPMKSQAELAKPTELSMSDQMHKRIFREATPEERERHRAIRGQVAEELPELEAWARAAAARHKERVSVGTILSGDEAKIVEAIDDYAAKHSLGGRSAVVREALSQLLGIELIRR